MKHWIFVMALGAVGTPMAQPDTPSAWANVLRNGHEQLSAAASDPVRLAWHDSLLGWWESALNAGLGNSEEMAVLEGRLAMPEAGRGKEWIRVISWNVELTDRTQRYGGFVLTADDQGGYATTPLEHDVRSGSWTANGRYTNDHWPGAIYYDIVLTQHKHDTYYTLLGWDGADALVTRKIVEPLWVKGARIRLGDRILMTPEGPASRMVLEYADDASVALRYEPENHRIVLDHLSPVAPHLKGMHAFYGPDMTYDALVWSKGTWLYEPDVMVADPNLNAPYNAPPPTARGRRRL